ncbi:exocyst complex component 8 [Chironomus tepperi]|uniref:exocyst complex component 8 n=1 Tax=Chironomus tepperi TaxID=113505 RepID=UPI00391F7F75
MDLEKFASEKFNGDDYVKHLVKEMVAGSELSEFRKQLTTEKEGVSNILKKKVFENYSQFIETAREISHLESEMYQLSHLLVDQRNLIEQIKEESLLDDQKNIIGDNTESNDNDQDQNKKALSIIKDALIGYNKSLDDKVFLHEGSLIELDPNDYRPICRSHLFLFNDILIIAKIKHDKKLEFMNEYETKKIAVVNIRELTGVKNAINIITSEGNRIYQTINAAARTEWMEKFEATLKFNQSSSVPAKSKKGPAPQPPKILQKQRSETQSICSDMTLSPTASIATENLAPEWLISAPEEIQAEIAQRHFEDSLHLIQKCEDYIQKNPSFYNINEIQEKIKNLKTILSSVLLHELSIAECRDLQSVLRSSRRLLKLLIEMGKSRESSTIFLKVCTTTIRTSQRQARRNNLPVSELFFCDLAQVASDFLRGFQKQAACTAALTVWCNDELQYFSQQLIKHYLTKGTNLETIAKVIESVREPCSELTKIGLDLSSHMEGLWRVTLEQLIDESRHRLIENIGRTEEIWQPYNLVSKSNLRVLLKEINSLGIDMNEHVTGDTFINLTQSTVNFCRHFLSVTESCAIIGKNSVLKPDCEKLLRDLFVTQHNIKPLATQQNVDLNFVAKNKAWLVDVLLEKAISDFEAKSEHKCILLTELKNQLKAPTPKPRNVYTVQL